MSHPTPADVDRWAWERGLRGAPLSLATRGVLAALGSRMDADGTTRRRPEQASIEQLAADLGVTTSAVRKHLDHARAAGYLRRDGASHRTWVAPWVACLPPMVPADGAAFGQEGAPSGSTTQEIGAPSGSTVQEISAPPRSTNQEKGAPSDGRKVPRYGAPSQTSQTTAAAADSQDDITPAVVAAVTEPARSAIVVAEQHREPIRAALDRGWTGHQLAEQVAAVKWSTASHPSGLLVRVLRDCAEAEPPRSRPERRPIGCGRCDRGWLGEDAEGRQIACPTCKPHLRRTARCTACTAPLDAALTAAGITVHPSCADAAAVA